MREYRSTKSCQSFMNMEEGGFVPSFVPVKQFNCRDCAFFSSRNCHREVADGMISHELFYY